MTPAHSRRASPLVLWRSYGFGLLLLALACLMAIKPAQAQLRVDISGTGATQYPVAIADFAVDDAHGRALAEVIRADLTRTGQFRLINAAGSGLNVDSPIAHDDWRAKGADFIAYGSIVRGNDGRYDLWLLGPNGFHRHVAGRLHADGEPLSVEAICDPAGPTLRLKLHNPGALARGFQVEANAYGYAGHHEPALAPGLSATVAWNLAASGGWYDFSVRADDAPGSVQRLAGRIETGAPSTSDPAMGQELILQWMPVA